MTSLRSFQNEIDQIQHREVVKQRTQAKIEQEKAKDIKKAPIKSPVADEVHVAHGEPGKSRDLKEIPLKSPTKVTATPADLAKSAIVAEEVAEEQRRDETVDQEKIQVGLASQ